MYRDKIAKIIGTAFSALTVFPFATPVLLSLLILVTRGKFLYDFFISAELFVFTLVGGLGVIVVLALMKKDFRKLAVTLSLALLNLIVSQVYTYVSGLAHGNTELTGTHLFIVSTFIVLYHFFAFLVVFESFRSLKFLRS
jgi:hypothetical protein